MRALPRFDAIGQDDGIPNLARQHRAYLDRQLLAFRSGGRLLCGAAPAIALSSRHALRAAVSNHLILINASKRRVQVNSIV
jgi:cytochrome c553